MLHIVSKKLACPIADPLEAMGISIMWWATWGRWTKKANGTRVSQAVTHPSTNPAQCCLTSASDQTGNGVFNMVWPLARKCYPRTNLWVEPLGENFGRMWRGLQLNSTQKLPVPGMVRPGQALPWTELGGAPVHTFLPYPVSSISITHKFYFISFSLL